MDWRADAPLGRWQKIAAAGFFLFLAAFGVLVERRSALMERRMGDLDVFLRAAWAIRNDADPYAITSDNGWHYIYPPLYAILLTPLADPPRDADPSGCVPYAISVAICYLINLLCLALGVHALASALEKRAEDAGFRTQPRFCVRWWSLRVWPVLICFLPIGHTLTRGQVNVIVLAILCAALAGWIHGQSFRAGLWLSLAIAIKVIPAFLLVYPLWKRDGRALAGCTVGLIAGLALVPLLCCGPAKTAEYYATYGRVFFAPFLRLNDDATNREEILGGVNATESVGVRNALHNWMYPDPAKRPDDMHHAAQIAYLILGVGMTLLTLWPKRNTSLGIAYCLGGLFVLMAIFSPVCHSHYLLFCTPIVTAMLAGTWEHQERVYVPWPLAMVFALFFVTMAIAYLPGLEILKDRCASLFVTLPLWAIPIARLWRRGAAVATVDAETRRLAA